MTGGQWVYVAPSIYSDLTRPPTARQKWKHARHLERWERRYGHPKRYMQGHVGSFDGIRIIRSTP